MESIYFIEITSEKDYEYVIIKDFFCQAAIE
jgi:hypothetical protein